MRKVELLAPAGNYECFLGAVHAGADAVYLGGTKFGARAYADNFTEDEVCNAIRYAHIYGRKVYLTLNTLIKERELEEVYEYLLPYYEAGLDGVIIQDLGVFQAVGEWFPLLPRHVSTQMTVTGSLGAAYLKELGAARIVPARELSLAEIKEIKKNVNIEIETFIHGAVCYCYSGQCLFSSMIGGRSGNRGKCAQPCRLPYEIEKSGRKIHPLSLKDMCTVELLNQLIEAGIDSFKIEGRMKSPEYTAGVTGIYRKYIDRYYENPSEYYVEKGDIEKLGALYIRSGISQGYYHKYNGRDMITLENPGYTGKDGVLEEKIRKTYLKDDFRLPVAAKARLPEDGEAELVLEWNGICAAVKGDKVQRAKKQPLTEDSVKKQLEKCKNTPFYLENLRIQMSEDIFFPVKSLNDLRRKAVKCLEEKIIKANGFCTVRENSVRTPEINKESATETYREKAEIHILATTKEQCGEAVKCGVDRLYMDIGLCGDKEWLKKLHETGPETRLYLALPYILRQKDLFVLEKAVKLMETSFFSGVLVRNLEELQYFRKMAAGEKVWADIVSDANLYIWNGKAVHVLDEICRESYVPYELNVHEISELLGKAGACKLSMTVYGRIPMMVSANCIANTSGYCFKKGNKGKKKEIFYTLTDRYGKIFPVYVNCIHCYNVIYNSLPLSLHRQTDELKEMGISVFRLDLTVENREETEKIIRFWTQQKIREDAPPYGEYTKGHLKRGAE